MFQAAHVGVSAVTVAEIGEDSNREAGGQYSMSELSHMGGLGSFAGIGPGKSIISPMQSIYRWCDAELRIGGNRGTILHTSGAENVRG